MACRHWKAYFVFVRTIRTHFTSSYLSIDPYRRFLRLVPLSPLPAEPATVIPLGRTKSMEHLAEVQRLKRELALVRQGIPGTAGHDP